MTQEKVFAFWEGWMPDYIKMCLDTWKREYVLLNYDNLNQYTELPIDKMKRFTLAQISDIVRVHVLRDNGGYWVDADTIMITGNIPQETMVGEPETRIHHCGQLHTQKNSPMFVEWAKYQDEILFSQNTPSYWGIFVNQFTDPYVAEHKEVTIFDRTNCFPELYMVHGDISNYDKYRTFYFESNFSLKDLRETDILMLHNSWTPAWYKDLTREDIMNNGCTLSNILKELV